MPKSTLCPFRYGSALDEFKTSHHPPNYLRQLSMPFPRVLIRKTLTRLLCAVHLAMGEPLLLLRWRYFECRASSVSLRNVFHFASLILFTSTSDRSRPVVSVISRAVGGGHGVHSKRAEARSASRSKMKRSRPRRAHDGRAIYCKRSRGFFELPEKTR